MTTPSSAATATLPVFHITHWKGGSTWVQGVLKLLAADRFVPRRGMHDHIYHDPIRPGGIYSPVYMHRVAFTNIVTVPHRRFIMIRDLRDTLVSWYFSARYSHPTDDPGMAARRAELERLDHEHGLLYMLENRLNAAAKIQVSWIRAAQESPEYIVRYEDLWADQHGGFARICEHIGLEVPADRLARTVDSMSFESRSGGRKPGEEDVRSHFRKGEPGDWRTHFTPRITDAFKERFGQALVLTGYEPNARW